MVLMENGIVQVKVLLNKCHYVSSFDPYKQSFNNYFLDLHILDFAINKIEVVASVHSVIDKFAKQGL
jgi:hypothetical protein